jgi:hypothetical protein
MAPLFLAAQGLDIHFNHRYLLISAIWAGFFPLILFAPAWILILLIRREMRRKRLAETSPQ